MRTSTGRALISLPLAVRLERCRSQEAKSVSRCSAAFESSTTRRYAG
jgi:hypothetical protein